MIGSSYFISDVSSSDEEERRLIANFADKLGADKVSETQFVAGTMFMVRTGILKPLIDSGLVNEKFERSESRKLGGTKAHAMERIFGILVALSKKTIVGYDKSLWKDIITSSFAHALRRFAFDKRITSNGRVLIRICRIPVWNFKYTKS
jgi:lipopolysaccharide biosynthesis protein